MKSFGNNESSAASANSAFFQKKSDQHFFSPASNTSSFFSNRGPDIQAKLTIGQPNDKYEQEAEAMADKVVQRLAAPESLTQKDASVQTKPLSTSITPFIQTKCAACEHEEKLQKKEDDKDEHDLMKGMLQKKPIFESNALPPDDENKIQRKCAECEKEDKHKLQAKSEGHSAEPASPSIESSLNASKGSGSPLPENTLTQMQSSFDADFSNVRIHNDGSAVQMSKNLNAQAFTHGSDIYFNSGKYDTNSAGGKHLLAHELTHTLQQNGLYSVQRECDPTISSCIPESYNGCNPTIASCPPPVASSDNKDPFELIQSKAPGSFQLLPIANPPDVLVADIPEGAVVAYNATAIPTSLNGTLPNMKATEFVAPGSQVLLSAVNQSLMQTGFAAIQGGNGIGLIAIPRLGTAGAMIPESLSTWGHTAAYVRINGQIAIVRGFTVESMMAAASNANAVTSGQGAVAGTISNDLSMFTITNARTVEWPVPLETAQSMAKSLPPEGAPPVGGPTQYTGRPGVYGQGASNCVGYACSAVEGPIGGQPATTKLGNIAEPLDAAEGLQGRMMQLTKSGAADVSPAGAVTSGMPLKFQILKWGGRLFLVLGAALTVHQVLTAKGEHKREEQGKAVGAFAGGVTLGAFAAGFCVGAGIATGGIALLVCAGVAGIAGTVGGHYAGGAIGRQFD